MNHTTMIEEKDTGRQMFSDINIEYGQTSKFNLKSLEFSYTYSGIPSANGLIKVVDKNDIDDNSNISVTPNGYRSDIFRPRKFIQID